jgi:predicted ABC-type transport system involved in lysophospholipase L1 biosynthesis ATPase subunit
VIERFVNAAITVVSVSPSSQGAAAHLVNHIGGLRNLKVVRYNNNTVTVVVSQLFQYIYNVLCVLNVKVPRRLVGEQGFRARRKASSYGNALLLTAR